MTAHSTVQKNATRSPAVKCGSKEEKSDQSISSVKPYVHLLLLAHFQTHIITIIVNI